MGYTETLSVCFHSILFTFQSSCKYFQWHIYSKLTELTCYLFQFEMIHHHLPNRLQSSGLIWIIRFCHRYLIEIGPFLWSNSFQFRLDINLNEKEIEK